MILKHMNYDTQRNEQEGRNSQNTSQAGGDSTKSRKSEKIIEGKEKWKEIVGFPKYKVSNLGNIKSEERVLTVKKNAAGYLVAHLYKHGKRNCKSVHRLVLLHFLPRNDAHLMEANHKNGSKEDSRLCNLEWVTTKENALHRVRFLGKQNLIPLPGSLNPYSRPVIKLTMQGNELARYSTLQEAADDGNQITGISMVCSGKQFSHRGYFWKYADDPKRKRHAQSGHGAPAPGWRLA